MNKKVFTMIGDVVASRHIKDTTSFQKSLHKTCEEVNERFKKDLIAKFTISKGIDEIEGVLSSISNIYRIIKSFLQGFYPERMRFVLVYDHINEHLSDDEASKLDGPAFHKAVKIMREMQNSKTNLLFSISTGNLLIDKAVNGNINSTLLVINSWTKRQFQIVKDYETTMSQSEIARKLSISQQAVSRILCQANWREVHFLEDNINSLLQESNIKILDDK
jgi:hypothetical protein